MTLFGTTLDGPAIAALVGMLLALVLWTMSLKGELGYARWFKQWEADRKARRDAELARERGEAPPPADGPPRGPWG
ncbi:hypothetical protein [Brevundimonas sp.]|uniref:hypothetical protein n=1 Tax=Brevundimonas sp. TaxID=1871086 RepID=UPI001A268CC4|nr:hypothetical protein [Brevundimonas sp.]MBJ7486348.1 hypothetical protein [Brevundimonas sp.]